MFIVYIHPFLFCFITKVDFCHKHEKAIKVNKNQASFPTLLTIVGGYRKIIQQNIVFNHTVLQIFTINIIENKVKLRFY
jgi:hypothetical protein